MDVSGVTDHVEAVALAYCTDQPLRLTGVSLALKISMKSFRKGAPEFPPPPKTWLITMCGDESGVGAGEGLGVGVGVGVAPASISDTGLLCAAFVETTSVAAAVPRNSAGMST